MNVESTRCRNAEATKRAVLDAAERLVAERGFAGTSMRDIGHAAGVSQPLIQHHFGRKEDLYAAVLRRAIECFTARFPDVAESGRPVDLGTETRRLFAFLRENELPVRMIGWARLEGKHELVAGAEVVRRALVRRIEHGQRLGLVREDIDAATLTVMLEGLVFYWIENRPLIALLFAEMPDDETYLRKAIALLERGFAPEAAGRPAGGKRKSPSRGGGPRRSTT